MKIQYLLPDYPSGIIWNLEKQGAEYFFQYSSIFFFPKILVSFNNTGYYLFLQYNNALNNCFLYNIP